MEAQYIDRAALMHSLDHARPDHPLVVQAFSVLAALDRFFSESDGGSSVPIPNLTVTPGAVALSIGEFGAWDSECDSEEDFTFEKCLEVYRDTLMQRMVPFSGGTPPIPAPVRLKE